MKNYRRISLFALCTAIFTVVFSIFAFAENATEHKVICTYDSEENILTADIYVSDGTAIVGYCSFDYNEDILTLIDKNKKEVPEEVPAYSDDGKTLYLKDIFESHGGIVITDISNGTKKLVNTKEGYAMFAWYFSDSNAVIDATKEDVLISRVSFKLKDGKTAADIGSNAFSFASKEITDKISGWYPAMFVMDKNYKQYSYADGSLKAEIVFDVSADTKPEDTTPEDTKPEDTKPEDTEHEDTKPEDTKPEDTEPEDTKPEDTKPEDTKPEDTKPEDTEPEDTKPEDTKLEDTKPEDTKPEQDSSDKTGYDFGLTYESTDTTVRIKWERPTDFVVAYYTLVLSDTSGNVISYIDGIAGITASYTLRDLAQSFTYMLTLRAHDDNGMIYEQSRFKASTKAPEGNAQIKFCKVTYNAGEGMIYGLAEETVVFGKSAEKLPDVIAPEGLYFIGWSENGTVPANVKNINVYSDRTYYAIYTDHPEVYEKGYISGYDDGTFKPEATINRAESAALFARVAGGYSDKANYTSSFSDVKKSDWYENVVSFCSKNGYIGGYEDGSFRPMSTITRAEFITIVCRIFGFEETSDTDRYEDISSHWAKNYINAFADNCSSTPFTESKFNPDKKITRREAVLVLNSALGIVPDIDSIIEYVRENGKYGRIFGDVSLSDPNFFDIAAAAVGKQ